MTLDDLKRLDREFLTPAQVADVLGCDAQSVRTAAQLKPELLGFPVCVVGHRTKIPKQAFLNWLLGTTIPDNARHY